MAQPGIRLRPSTLTIFKHSDELAAHAADFIVRSVQGAIAARGRGMIALSGGTTPQPAYAFLAEPARRNQVDWTRTFIFLADERFVRTDDPASNFGMIQRTLLAPVSADPTHVFPIPTQLET